MHRRGLQEQAGRYLTWLRDAALPFWAERGVDAEGGFYEHLHLDGSPDPDAVRRLRVQARQIYVYGLATRRGWHDGKAVMRRTWDFMIRHGYEPDGREGFIHRLNPDYSVKNDRRDLYDHAFYFFASRHAYAALGDEVYRRTSDAILDFTDGELIRMNGGWGEGLPDTLPRRQNPHMHWFEAFMSTYSLSENPIWLTRASELYALFETHFYDPEHQIVREFFDEDWTVAAGERGDTVEPGHGAEWVWLLGQYEKLTGTKTEPAAAALYARICKGEPEFLRDEEDISGTVRRDSKRLWCQTEYVKASLARFEAGNDAAGQRAERILAAMMATYLQADGTWIDQIDGRGQACAKTIPVSTFYHIICMIDELVRVSGYSD